MTKITTGCYVETSEIKDTEQWMKVIDAFVKAGYKEWEGYSSDASRDYTDYWGDYNYVGIDDDEDIVHHNSLTNYYCPVKSITLEELLLLENKPLFRIEKNLSDMADHSKIETLEEICSEGWKLGGIEPNGDYIFYQEK